MDIVKVFTTLASTPVPTLLIVLGVFLFILSLFDVELKEFKFKLRQFGSISQVIVGGMAVMLIGVGILIYLLSSFVIPSAASSTATPAVTIIIAGVPSEIATELTEPPGPTQETAAPIVPSDTPLPPPSDTPTPIPTATFTLTPSPTATFTPTAAISPEDCLPYNPANLQIVDKGSIGWQLTDGVSSMLILNNQADAQDALALARRYTAHCFIGRGNTRPNRRDYIVEYWKGTTGVATTLSRRDCIPYNRANLQIIDKGSIGWQLTDGVSSMLILDNQQDAQNALILARRYTNQCFIGRDNTRPDRSNYIVDYWE